MVNFALTALLCMVSTAYAESLTLRGDSLALASAVNEARALLPENYLSDASVEISLRRFPSDSRLGSDLCKLPTDATLGRTLSKRGRHRIEISEKLFELARSNTRTFSCLHGNFQKTLIGTIVHELTHVKDLAEELSTEPDFERLMGVRRLTSNPNKAPMNQNVAASPDPYEFENLAEALAVNVEYLLLDPEYRCRRPATATYLQARLGLQGSSTCQQNTHVLIQSAYLEDNYLTVANIAPERVYAVHYLFAGKGKAIMSRWGHAMFRLIVCAPHRKVPGPECLKDVSHHVVLSYRAEVTDLVINYVKGLKGEYPSQLFLLRFHEVQQEYTKFELRELYSVPLMLERGELKAFLDLTLERYWGYQGKYYFLDNNCGTEALKHLSFALPEDKANELSSITPERLFRGLNREGFAAVDQVVRYEGLGAELKKTYELLRRRGFYGFKTLEKFIKKSKASDRLAEYRRYFSANPADRALLMRLVYLERYLTSVMTRSLPGLVMKKARKDAELAERLRGLSRNFQLLNLAPWDVVRARYGVPSPEEFARESEAFTRAREKVLERALEDQLAEIQSIMGGGTFKNELSELENLEHIKTLFNGLLTKGNL